MPLRRFLRWLVERRLYGRQSRRVKPRLLPSAVSTTTIVALAVLFWRPVGLGAETVPDDVAMLAAVIDEQIEAAWRKHGVTPAPIADDAEFLRRVSLDLAGRIPSVWEVRAFLESTDPRKRRLVVDQLLESPAFFSHFAVKWRHLLIPDNNVDIQLRFQLPGFDSWLRHKLMVHTGYDRLVRDVLAFSLSEGSQSTVEAFYNARDTAPENLAAATSRIFLGVRLECAQCHDHPFSHWKQDEFWSLAAFFAGIAGGRIGKLTENVEIRTIQVPGSSRIVEARFPDGRRPEFGNTATPRQVLADWITANGNPYFARTAVNRVWADLFGFGIVDPPDDFDEANHPSHPELLDKLAREFASHGYDVQFLMRGMIASRAYQLTSRQSDISQRDLRLFARRAVRGLTADQLFDSLGQAAGYHDRGIFRDRERQIDSPRVRFRELFEDQAARPAESQATILQALAMMNGEFVEEATDANRNPTLTAVIDAPFLTDAERIETLYLAKLSRRPRAEDVERLIAYLESNANPERNDGDAKSAAFADIFWALLNSSEFAANH